MDQTLVWDTWEVDTTFDLQLTLTLCLTLKMSNLNNYKDVDISNLD
jgi:hypothetical protein